MRRKVLFLFFIFFILITSFCVVKAGSPTSIEYDGFTYDLSGLEIYSKTFAYYNSYAKKIVVVSAVDSAIVKGWNGGFSVSGSCKIYYFKKGINRLESSTSSEIAASGSGNYIDSTFYSNFDILDANR